MPHVLSLVLYVLDVRLFAILRTEVLLPTLSIRKSTIIFSSGSFSILNFLTISLVIVVRTIPFRYFRASA